MDNHAGNFNRHNLKWLGGMIDSDGSIGISKSIRKSNNIVYTPSVAITSSSSFAVEYIDALLSAFDINHHIKGNSNGKNITINRPTVLDNFFRLMFENILVKSNELRLLHQFCLHRIKNVEDAGCNWKAKYTSHEIGIAEELSTLNKIHYRECEEYGIIDGVVNENILKLFDLYWLAGFIDGDGCITINKLKRKDGTFQYQPMLHIVTGSPLAKNILVTWLDRYNINYYLKKSLSGVKHKPNCSKKKFEFYIRSLEDCSKLGGLLLKKLYTKNKRCEHLIKFCESRMERVNKPYSDFEIDRYQAIQTLISIKDSSTTKRGAFINEDIV